MLAIARSATLLGVQGTQVSVEVHVSGGLPGFTIVGLPDTSCREARDRVRAALLSSGFKWPDQRTTVNLAPSGIRKIGAGLDVAIAMGVLRATGQLSVPIPEYAYLGELGLDGTVRPILGVVPLAAAIEPSRLIVAEDNVTEAHVVGRHDVHPVGSLTQLVAATEGRLPWETAVARRDPEPPPGLDLSEVRGNGVARFALEVAAAGGHHLLMVGPPGAGKTMLAERLPSILGPLDDRAAIEVTTVHSAAGQPLPASGLIRVPPFRSPHHTVSQVALVGGGSHALRPGEISLSHGGVLFLDELGEFAATAIDALRQPLESGEVRISRAHAAATMPASFQLVASMNPCPCGFAGSPTASCRCSSASLTRYARRVSGPLLDRFDLRLRLEPTPSADLLGDSAAESSEAVAQRVAAARERALGRGVRANRFLTGRQLAEIVEFEPLARRLLDEMISAGALTGRGLRRITTMALTLDDLRHGGGRLDRSLIAQALALRADLRFGEADPIRFTPSTAAASGVMAGGLR